MIKLLRLIGEEITSPQEIKGGLLPNYHNLSTELNKYGVHTTIMCPTKNKTTIETNKDYTIKKIKVPKFNTRLWFYLLNKTMEKEIQKEDYDIIQLHNFYYYWLQKKLRTPNVLTIHGCDIKLKENRRFLNDKSGWYSIRTTIFRANKMVKNAAQTIGVSKATTKEINKYYKPKTKARTIYNGTNLDLFYKTNKEIFNKKYFNIIFVGRNVEWKRTKI